MCKITEEKQHYLIILAVMQVKIILNFIFKLLMNVINKVLNLNTQNYLSQRLSFLFFTKSQLVYFTVVEFPNSVHEMKYQ
jgi:hypothetical protein